ERLEDVGGAAARAYAPVAVLGDRQAACGRDKGGRGRDSAQPPTGATRAATIGEQIIWTIEGQRGGRKRARRADHFFGGFALHPEGDEHSRNLGRLERGEHRS